MTVIQVENLGKKYTIGHQKGTRYQTLRDTLAHTGRGVWQRLRYPLSPNREIVDLEEIWALRDVNFEIKQGERVGIIGRNGAGKSTLLKILSRITHPTTGRVTITGRVASLLEVGTGFHPELTGRENIYLNGAILGMTRQEINSKFDEIVAFAEVEKFLDTPVKHYSSGMYVRLAFAVAAHLEPEILLVDEVLAVGDAQFQKKCLGKMEDVAKEGRTVLFVSHNMAAIQTLCSRVILISKGSLQQDDFSESVIRYYLDNTLSNNKPASSLKTIDHKLEITNILIKNKIEQITNVFMPNDSLIIEIFYNTTHPILNVYWWISIVSQFGSLFGANMLLDGRTPERLYGSGYIRCIFPKLPLLPQQTYIIRMGMREADGRSFLLHAEDIGYFSVMGAAREIGLYGEIAETLIGSSAPMLIPYTWEFSDGKTYSVYS